jgi:hypothetical protein
MTALQCVLAQADPMTGLQWIGCGQVSDLAAIEDALEKQFGFRPKVLHWSDSTLDGEGKPTGRLGNHPGVRVFWQ